MAQNAALEAHQTQMPESTQNLPPPSPGPSKRTVNSGASASQVLERVKRLKLSASFGVNDKRALFQDLVNYHY